jgi:uncharacterized protein YutE (UPF0331/DUF86 family)
MFDILAENGILEADKARRYRLMAQFRNLLVHYYEKIDPEQVYAIYTQHVNDFVGFRETITVWMKSQTK